MNGKPDILDMRHSRLFMPFLLLAETFGRTLANMRQQFNGMYHVLPVPICFLLMALRKYMIEAELSDGMMDHNLFAAAIMVPLVLSAILSSFDEDGLKTPLSILIILSTFVISMTLFECGVTSGFLFFLSFLCYGFFAAFLEYE